MKKILLISDTHSYIDDFILKYVKKVDEVWHAGDIGNIQVVDDILQYKPLVAVHGNIDSAQVRAEFPENQIFTREKVKVFMTHIGGYPGKYSARVKKIIQDEKPNLFVCGHSHILKVMYDPQYQMMTMNPGACGNHGFHQKKTMLKFDIDGSELKNLEVIEKNR